MLVPHLTLLDTSVNVFNLRRAIAATFRGTKMHLALNTTQLGPVDCVYEILKQYIHYAQKTHSVIFISKIGGRGDLKIQHVYVGNQKGIVLLEHHYKGTLAEHFLNYFIDWARFFNIIKKYTLIALCTLLCAASAIFGKQKNIKTSENKQK